MRASARPNVGRGFGSARGGLDGGGGAAYVRRPCSPAHEHSMADDPILAHTRVAAPGRTPERWLLVLHGIYGAGRNWGSIARRLVEARPEWGAVLVDLRMHGQSRG